MKTHWVMHTIEVQDFNSQTAEVIPRRVTLIKADIVRKGLVRTTTDETLHIEQVITWMLCKNECSWRSVSNGCVNRTVFPANVQARDEYEWDNKVFLMSSLSESYTVWIKSHSSAKCVLKIHPWVKWKTVSFNCVIILTRRLRHCLVNVFFFSIGKIRARVPLCIPVTTFKPPTNKADNIDQRYSTVL